MIERGACESALFFLYLKRLINSKTIYHEQNFIDIDFLFSCIACVFAQGELPEETVDYAANFATFAGVVGVTTVVTEFIKKLFKTEPSEWVQRIISWVIGIGLGMFAWGFHLGMFEGLDWWQALLWGFGVGLASNGFWDTGLIEWLFGLFTKKKAA
jgi:hypothetical protein